MSYCVHCGVELAVYEKACPLCGTKVIDPNRESESAETMFEDGKAYTDRKVNMNFLLFMIAMLLLLPLGVVIVCDLLVAKTLTWSLYVLGSEICIWMYFVFPLNLGLKKPYFYIFADTVATAMFLLCLDFATGAGVWFAELALPLTLAAGVFVLGITYIARKVKNKLVGTGLAIGLLILLLFCIDLTVCHFAFGAFRLIWAWYACIPLAVLAIALFIIAKSKKLFHWIERRLYI